MYTYNYVYVVALIVLSDHTNSENILHHGTL